jgi:hypothetical protein
VGDGTGAQILTDVLQAKANIVALNQGYDPDTVVVDDINFAYAMAAFVAPATCRGRGNQQPGAHRRLPRHRRDAVARDAEHPDGGHGARVDSQQLGGMADEDLGGPGLRVRRRCRREAKTIRDDDNDQWRLRCRRVTVPVVVEPAAGRKITGYGSTRRRR